MDVGETAKHVSAGAQKTCMAPPPKGGNRMQEGFNMKENKYDNEAFFESYSNMPRSKEGLPAAGEWHALEQLLPDFSQKRVLDLGCGYGWHCIYAAAHGAKKVIGTDISANMLKVAREKTTSPLVDYVQIAMEDIAYPACTFDIVLSSLAFHYVKDIEPLYKKVFGLLTPGGAFIFSAEHPVFTAQGPQCWVEDAKGAYAHWPVDGYFLEGAREALFLGTKVTKYHRTLTSYVQGLLDAGFELRALCEPQPAQHMLETIPGMQNELRRPMLLLLLAHKPE